MNSDENNNKKGGEIVSLNSIIYSLLDSSISKDYYFFIKKLEDLHKNEINGSKGEFIKLILENNPHFSV